MKYRRAKTIGGTYFFTLVTYQRQKLFSTPQTIDLLRQAFRTVKTRYPFTIDAIVILPDHLHWIWTLPPDDADFSQRWRLIKTEFSRHCPDEFKHFPNKSRISKGEQAIWQRRFWEHQIKDETDFTKHVEYINLNPVHHKLVAAPKDWEYSSFLRYVDRGLYPLDWGV
jgi:putative transposase